MNFIKENKFIKISGFLVLCVVVLLLPILFPNPGRIGMFISCAVASVLAMGWLVILRIGCLSLGQVAFLAIGAYASAIFSMKFGVNPWLCLLLGGVVTGLIALGIGAVFLRVKGLSLSIITFAFAECVRLIISNIEYLGGHGGIMDIPQLPAIGGVAFNNPFSAYYVMLVILAVSGVVMWRLDSSAFGRTFKAITQNDSLAMSVGVNPLHYRIIGFVVPCFFAGVAGAFTAHYYACLYPGSYGVSHSVIVQIQATVGGAASVALGGILGASLLVIIETWLLNVDARLVFIFYGIVIIAVTFGLPDGLLSVPRELKKLWKYLKDGGTAGKRSFLNLFS
jgi:branched-chain amino acid transport system permease protein